MIRVSRVFAVAAVVVAAGVIAGCGSSKSATPPTTTQIPTLPKKTTSLRVENFPSALTGNVTFVINQTQGT